jgi:integrase
MIGCSTGLRVSDYTRLTPDHFLERDGRRFLQVLTTKTKREVIVPIDPVVEEIYERYG